MLFAAQEAAACEGPPWWTIGRPAPDGQVAALWRGALYRINPSDGQFAEIAKTPVGGGSLCFKDGELYLVTADRFPPSLVAILKAAPLLIVTPHRDSRPAIWRLQDGGLAPVAEGPRLAYHYGAAPLGGRRAVFLGYRHGAMKVTDQDGAVWRRQAVSNPTILQSPAALGVGPGERIHTAIVTRRTVAVTTFDTNGKVTSEVRLDLPDAYRSARVDRRFVKFLGGGADGAFFWVSAGRDERGNRRSSLPPLIVTVSHKGAASLRQAPEALADTCSAHHVSINHDLIAVLCTPIAGPVVKLWSQTSGQVREIEVSKPFLNPAGFVKPGLILTATGDAGFALMALEGEGSSPVLRAVQVQSIR